MGEGKLLYGFEVLALEVLLLEIVSIIPTSFLNLSLNLSINTILLE